MTEIANRTAFITGGANGIGLGIARSLAREGAKLILVDLEADALKSAEAELGQVTEVFTAVLDVRDRDAYVRVADEAEAKVGPVSILINNAGVSGGAAARKMTYDLWDWGLGINLGGVVNGVQTFLPRILERGAGGHIVNTASGAGLVPPVREGGMLYATAKYAVVGMTEALSVELEPVGIGVSVLCPGPVATDIVMRTRAAQSKVEEMETLTDGARAKLEQTRQYLANGTSPNAVGDMVRDAIRNHQLYVYTDRIIVDRLHRRNQALVEALPAE